MVEPVLSDTRRRCAWWRCLSCSGFGRKICSSFWIWWKNLPFVLDLVEKFARRSGFGGKICSSFWIWWKNLLVVLDLVEKSFCCCFPHFFSGSEIKPLFLFLSRPVHPSIHPSIHGRPHPQGSLTAIRSHREAPSPRSKATSRAAIGLVLCREIASAFLFSFDLLFFSLFFDLIRRRSPAARTATRPRGKQIQVRRHGLRQRPLRPPRPSR